MAREAQAGEAREAEWFKSTWSPRLSPKRLLRPPERSGLPSFALSISP